VALAAANLGIFGWLWRKDAPATRPVRLAVGASMTSPASTPVPHASAHTPLSVADFERQFAACSRLLWCIASGVLGDRDRARDVVQDAAIVGLAKRHEFMPGTSFPHWMGQIVRYTALNEARKEKVRAVRGSDTLEALPLASPPSDPGSPITPGGGLAKLQESFDDATVKALAQLEETARSCLLLRTVLDMGYAEIGAALGIPEGTAMSHVHRSRQKMRGALMDASAQKGHE
jgi:RNA polymerase sigma-70 factor (ECF subfamily)